VKLRLNIGEGVEYSTLIGKVVKLEFEPPFEKRANLIKRY